jgi:cytochrome c oxidase subunit IV
MDISVPASEGKHPSHFYKYMEVAMILAVLTGVEIIIIWLPFSFWPIFITLAVLSLAKFVYVVVYFMHLRWEKLLCTLLFLSGLIIATATSVALHAIFSMKDSIPYGG